MNFTDKCIRKIIMILFFGIVLLSCAKENSVGEETSILKISDYRLTNIWVCERVESRLLGADTDVNKFINNKLNSFIPHTTINKGSEYGGCWFILPDISEHKFMKRVFFDLQDSVYIKFDYRELIIPSKEGSNSFTTSGVIKNGKLYLTFLRDDFEIFTWLIEEDYPYNKALIKEATTGEVTLIYTPVYPIVNG